MLKQVFLINQDLKMGKGKIAVQVAHGEVYFITEIENALFEDESIINYGNYQNWLNEENGLMKKIVLKATEDEIHKFIDNYGSKYWMKTIYDRGLTQVLENSLTCLVVEPLPEEQCDKLFGHLKLL